MKVKLVTSDNFALFIYKDYFEKNGMDKDIEIIGTHELCEPIEDIPSGENHIAQAREIAMAYYKKTGGPIVAYGSAVYFDGVPEELQPGTEEYIVDGKKVSKDGWLDHCLELAKKYGEQLSDDVWSYSIIERRAHAICLIDENGNIYEAAENRDDLPCASKLYFSDHEKGKKWFYFLDKYGPHYFEYFEECISTEKYGKVYTELLKTVLSEMEKAK